MRFAFYALIGVLCLVLSYALNAEEESKIGLEDVGDQGHAHAIEGERVARAWGRGGGGWGRGGGGWGRGGGGWGRGGGWGYGGGRGGWGHRGGYRGGWGR